MINCTFDFAEDGILGVRDLVEIQRNVRTMLNFPAKLRKFRSEKPHLFMLSKLQHRYPFKRNAANREFR